MPRTLAVTKRVSLADVADGWTDEAYAIVKPATRSEYQEIAATDTDDNDAVMKLQDKLVSTHTVRGKVFILGDDDQLTLDDLQPEDVSASIVLNNVLFAAITGVTYDPKDGLTPTASQPTVGSTTAPQTPTDSTTTQ